MRHLAFALCGAALCAPLLAAQAPTKRSPEQIKASLDAHQAEFDYLLGDWEFTSVSAEFGKGRGFWSAVRLAEGAQILDEYRIVGDVSAYAWNDFPDRDKILSVTLTPPPGTRNRFVSYVIPMARGQRIRILKARRSGARNREVLHRVGS